MAEPEHGDFTVSAWIRRFARPMPHTLTPTLDVACGRVRYVRLLPPRATGWLRSIGAMLCYGRLRR